MLVKIRFKDLDQSAYKGIELRIIKENDCQNAYPGLITSRMMCIGCLEGGKDSCKGDGGGPVVCHGELQGIVSWGYKCGERNRPSVYTNVCKFHDWIAREMFLN